MPGILFYRSKFSSVLMATALMIAVCVLAPARAQTPSMTLDPGAVDVGGVKLGMTPDQAMDALKNFDPALAVSKKYVNGRGLQYGMEGASMDAISEADKRTAYLDGLAAIKGAPTTTCRTPTFCQTSYDDDEETIKVWFSRVPGNEQVIAVQRQKQFHKKPAPAIPSLKAAIFDKYPEGQVTYQHVNGIYDTIGWLFDSRKRFLSSAAAKAKGIQELGGLPRTVHPDDGFGLTVMFTSSNQSDQIADSFSQTLYDANGLFKSIEQSKSAYDAMKTKADASQLEQSLKSAGQTKF